MNADFMKYLGFVGLLVFTYLVVFNSDKSKTVINSLSAANTNAILALQGRTPSSVL